MGSGKIFFLLLVLVIGTYALRFFGSVSPQGSSSPTSTLSGASTTISGAGSRISPGPRPAYAPPVVDETPIQPQNPVLSIATSQIPQGFTRNQLSPHFRKISFASVAVSGNIILSSNLGEGDSPINVTGWLIKSQRGGQIIPQAVSIYDPTGLAPETDIYMRPNDELRIFSSQSAIGKNLRLNKCIGTLENENHFTPSLPGYCPAIYKDYSEISGFTGKCQDYISSLSYCTPPDLNSASIPRNDYACQSYLQNNVNFRGCFDKYRGDANFLTNKIWVWTGNDSLMDPRHDRVLLLDNAGLLVDEYSY